MSRYQDLVHKPVMLKEVLQYLQPKAGEIYIDCTFGAGGYSKAILKAADAVVYGIDQDPDVMPLAEALSKEFGSRFKFVAGNFADLDSLMSAQNIQNVDAIILDLGVSSMQLESAERGFSFMNDGPLDMRMNKTGQSAYDFINGATQEEIANVIYKYGNERKSRLIAKKIIETRKEMPIKTTLELADIVRSVIKRGSDKIDPATKTFQAIRIFVNDELYALEKLLAVAERLLSEDGRLIVVSFHSLEDSIVKEYINQRIKPKQNWSRHLPFVESEEFKPKFKWLKNKVIAPSDEEVASNPRSRSAKMRAAVRINREVEYA